MILDGKDGSKLFVMNSTQYQMSSVLTLHTTQGHRDLFITKVRGRGSQIGGESSYGIMGLSRTQQVTIFIYCHLIKFPAHFLGHLAIGRMSAFIIA